MSSKSSKMKDTENIHIENIEKPRVVNSREFGTVVIGITVTLLFTVIFRFITAVYNDLASNAVFSDALLTKILGVIVSDVSDEVIYGLGCAIILIAALTGEKRMAVIATILVSLEIFIDYTASYVIDYFTVMVKGTEIFTAIYLIINFVYRSLIYALIAVISYKKSINNNGINYNSIRVLSKHHPANKIILWAVLFRNAPFIAFEIYSNITGFIEYGFDLTGKDVIAITSAYLEILIRAAIDYVIILAFYALLSLRNKYKKAAVE